MSRSCDWCNTRVVGTEPEWVCGKCFAGVRAERDAALAAQSAAEHALRDLAAREAKVGEYEDAILRLERERDEARTVRDVATTAVNDIGVAMQKEQAAHAETERRALALAASGERMRAALLLARDFYTLGTKVGAEPVTSERLSGMVRDAAEMNRRIDAALSPSPSPGLGAAVVACVEALRELKTEYEGGTPEEVARRPIGAILSQRAHEYRWSLTRINYALTAYEAAVAGAQAQDAQGQGKGQGD